MFLLSCKENSIVNPQEQLEFAKLKAPKDKQRLAVEEYSSCVVTYPSPITTYNTFSDPVNSYSEGFGRFPNDAYDRGWRSGYEDGVYWHNYYGIVGDDPGCTQGSIKLVIGDVNSPGGQKYVDPGYQLQAGETNYGPIITIGTCGANAVLKRCILKNAYSSKNMRMQYAFNNTYPGRTDDQISFDSGRLSGYDTAINFEPVSVAP